MGSMSCLVLLLRRHFVSLRLTALLPLWYTDPEPQKAKADPFSIWEKVVTGELEDASMERRAESVEDAALISTSGASTIRASNGLAPSGVVTGDSEHALEDELVSGPRLSKKARASERSSPLEDVFRGATVTRVTHSFAVFPADGHARLISARSHCIRVYRGTHPEDSGDLLLRYKPGSDPDTESMLEKQGKKYPEEISAHFGGFVNGAHMGFVYFLSFDAAVRWLNAEYRTLEARGFSVYTGSFHRFRESTGAFVLSPVSPKLADSGSYRLEPKKLISNAFPRSTVGPRAWAECELFVYPS